MFTNDKILYFLKYLKKKNGSTGEHLRSFIETHLSIFAYGKFLNYIDDKGYIYHTQSSQYYITKKGNLFIIKQNIIKYAKIAILYFIVPIIVILTFVFQFIWKPDFLIKEKIKMNQTEIIDLKSDTLSKKDSILLKPETDIK